MEKTGIISGRNQSVTKFTQGDQTLLDLERFKERHQHKFKKKIDTHYFPKKDGLFVFGIRTAYSNLLFYKGRGEVLEEAVAAALEKAKEKWPKRDRKRDRLVISFRTFFKRTA
jgi:hypothetical protein